MNTRNLLLAALVAAAPLVGLSAPADTSAKPPASTDQTIAKPSDTTVSVKDTAAPAATTKSKDAAGNDTLSVDFPDEDSRNILRNVADLFDLNLVIPETLTGKTSVKLHDVTWRQIFQVVLEPVGYTYLEEGNIIKIVSKDAMDQEPVSTEVFILNYARASDIQPTVASLVDTTKGKLVVDTRSNSLVITERPSRMARIRPIIEQLDKATDQVMIESKFVEISDNNSKNLGVNWSSLNGYNVAGQPGYTYSNNYGTSKTTTPSVNNSNGVTTNGNTTTTTSPTSVAQTTTDTESTLPGSASGVSTVTTTTGATNTSTTTNSIASTLAQATSLAQTIATTSTNANAISAVFSADQFKLVLSALQTLDNTRIISNPTIVTLNNTEAQINVAEEDPIPNYPFHQQTGTFEVSGFTYQDIGIILKVTPQVNARGFIKLTLSPEVSQKNGTASFGGASGTSIPIIATRKATTQVSLKDGYTMAIGGLISSNNSKTTNTVPLLGSIPVLGYLFKSDSTNKISDNLIIFITAKTISAEGAPIEQIFNSRDLRAIQLHKDDLPGSRDGSSPFVEDLPPAKKK